VWHGVFCDWVVPTAATDEKKNKKKKKQKQKTNKKVIEQKPHVNVEIAVAAARRALG
jgi:hypothetical protein